MELEREPLDIDEFPPNLQKHVQEGAPEKMKMMAAQGMVPAPPAQQVQLLYQLHFDDDVAGEVVDALEEMPENVIVGVVEEDQPAGLLDWIAEVRDEPSVLEAIVLDGDTADETLCYLAETADGETCRIISNNEVRILGSPQIIQALYKNPEVGQATVDQLIELAQRNEVDLSQFPELSQAVKGVQADDDEGLDDDEFQQLLDEETQKAGVEEEKLKKLDEEDLTRAQRERLEKEVSEKIDFDDEEEDGDAEADQEEGTGRDDIRQKIREMNVGQKIRLATVGSREAIKQLVKDPNKLVHEAAIESPRIKLGDVKRLSSKKSLPEGVIEHIAQNRDWTSDYEVMTNLVHNPKAPLSEVSTFLKRMRRNDLKKVQRDRDVPHQVRRMAKRRLKQK